MVRILRPYALQIGFTLYIPFILFLDAHVTSIYQQYGVGVLTFAVLGGSGFVLGPVVGAMIITLLPYIFDAAGPYINIVSGIFLIVVIIFRPQGIVGRGGLAIIRPSWWPRRARVSAATPG